MFGTCLKSSKPYLSLCVLGKTSKKKKEKQRSPNSSSSLTEAHLYSSGPSRPLHRMTSDSPASPPSPTSCTEGILPEPRIAPDRWDGAAAPPTAYKTLPCNPRLASSSSFFFFRRHGLVLLALVLPPRAPSDLLHAHSRGLRF
jgi:hypothetical protein